MQYKVPQNVDIADKVIAGLTLRQFMFLMVAGGIILMSNYIFIGGLRFLFIPIAVLIGISGIALAFFKINDRPFEIFLISAAKNFINPTKRIWFKEINQEPIKIAEKDNPQPKYTPKKTLGQQRSNLQNLATMVDSGITDNDPDRISNIRAKSLNEPAELHDPLADTEKPSEKLKQIIDDATNFVAGQKKEKPVSTMASVRTKKDDFQYENIKLKNKKEVDEIVAAVNGKEPPEEQPVESQDNQSAKSN
jgi:hypothetical protein